MNTAPAPRQSSKPPTRKPARKKSQRPKGAKAKAKANEAPDDPKSPYLRTPAAARYIKMSEEYLEAARYRGDGSGPAYIKHKNKRAVVYRISDLDEFMAAGLHAADKPV